MAHSSVNWTIMVYISADGVLANFAVESLKQLKRAAGNGVVVAAQVDTNGTIQAQRYVFDESGDLTSLADSKPKLVYPAPRLGTPDPKSLTDFIDWASEKFPAKRYGLFLWGHGVELLLDEDSTTDDPKGVHGDGNTSGKDGNKDAKEDPGKPVRKYLTPSNLKKALGDTRLPKAGKSLGIIGMDACSMSMVEIASELGEYVEFMVASQEDVPDTSFPYGEILSRLRGISSAGDASKMIPTVYLEAFRDYIANPSTGVRGITLSALNLSKMGRVTAALSKLAKALLALSSDGDARKEILAARKSALGFVFGLFVDISDFCKKLESRNIPDADLKSACAEMRAAIEGNEVVVENQAQMVGNSCNGLSIYFPYRIPDETENLQEVRAKGGTNRPLKGGTNRPLKERSLRIEELEEDFAALPRFKETGWNEFIKRGWSFILAKEEPRELDEVYSAQQCAQNLGSSGHDGKPPVVVAMPSPREKQTAVNQ